MGKALNRSTSNELQLGSSEVSFGIFWPPPPRFLGETFVQGGDPPGSYKEGTRTDMVTASKREEVRVAILRVPSCL